MKYHAHIARHAEQLYKSDRHCYSCDDKDPNGILSKLEINSYRYGLGIPKLAFYVLIPTIHELGQKGARQNVLMLSTIL